MEIGEKSLGASARPPLSRAGSSFAGILQGPGGPLVSWPFLLLRNGRPVDPTGLGSGSTGNEYRDGSFWSGPGGEFRFEHMPEGCYELRVLLAGGKVKAATQSPPPAESGLRGARPEWVDLGQSREDPTS